MLPAGVIGLHEGAFNSRVKWVKYGKDATSRYEFGVGEGNGVGEGVGAARRRSCREKAIELLRPARVVGRIKPESANVVGTVEVIKSNKELALLLELDLNLQVLTKAVCIVTSKPGMIAVEVMRSYSEAPVWVLFNCWTWESVSGVEKTGRPATLESSNKKSTSLELSNPGFELQSQEDPHHRSAL